MNEKDPILSEVKRINIAKSCDIMDVTTPQASDPAVVWLIFLCCVLLGPLNFILYKIMYSVYEQEGAFFVSQCVNVMYVLFGYLALVYVSMKNEITEEMKNISHSKYSVMGLLDCLAGFLAAMGASKTSGAAQQLLNQALIPCTMLSSFLFLGRRASLLQVGGAIVILFGAAIVIWPALDSSNFTHAIPIVIYFCSNIPFSASYVYKEYAFKNLEIHVIYLTQWVSTYQLLLGFLMAPFQMIPGIGSENGFSFHQIIDNFGSGVDCFLERSETCKRNSAFLFLIGYCIVNFSFNTLGLFLVKNGSATFNAISYAIILPLTTLGFSVPLLGRYRESFQLVAIIGLGVVLFGFFLWKYESIWDIEPQQFSLLDSNSIHSEPVEHDFETNVLFNTKSKLSSSYEEQISCNEELSDSKGIELHDIVGLTYASIPIITTSSEDTIHHLCNSEQREHGSYSHHDHQQHYSSSLYKKRILPMKGAADSFHERTILASFQ